MEAALYGEGGFFTTGHGAGRAERDFVTSPEVGSLFGACVARAVDRLWDELGQPDPFLVVEAGAGNGRLARDVLRAEPRCAPALRYVLVERSPALRAEQRDRLALEPADEALGPFVRAASDDHPLPQRNAGPLFTALDELPALEATDALLIGNELLDNLPFGIAEWDGTRWLEVRIAASDDGFTELSLPADTDLELDIDQSVAAGTRVPIPRGLREWAYDCDAAIGHGFALLIDYMTPAANLSDRPWLRTYRGHQMGASPLENPGAQDITGDIVLEQLQSALPFSTLALDRQSEWLRALGIEDLVTEGRVAWDEGAARGDLAALAGRSRIGEAEALTDPAGLGAHHVALFGKGVGGNAFAWRR